MFLQVEVSVGAEHGAIELPAPLHDGAGVALDVWQRAALHDDGGEQRVVIHHHRAAPAEALYELHALISSSFLVNQLPRLPAWKVFC